MSPRAAPLWIVLLCASTAHAGLGDRIFADGFETADVWGWKAARNAPARLGDCPCTIGDGSGTVFYVDPVAGNDQTGDGSAGTPWASIQFVVANKVDCTDQHGVPRHADAPVQGGDTIVLVGAGGHDQELDITGCYNADYVTIRSAVHQEATLAFVHFRGSAYWRLDGLNLVNGGRGIMVRVEDHSHQGPAHHLQIVNSSFTSGDLQTVQDYLDHVSDGIRLYSDQGPVLVRCNQMHAVAMGFVVSGDRLSVVANTVEHFSRDGIATGGHRNRFIGNRIFDAVKLGDGHHDDFFQSHMGANPDTSSDVEIAYNIFVNRYDAGQPAGSYGPTQCLSAFEDGPKTRIHIYNNLCKADHWHGITWYDTRDSVIVNNTAVGGSDYPGLPPGSGDWPTRTWISVDDSDNVVRNNLTTRNLSGGDHNLEVTPGEEGTYFTDWLALDLTLPPGSPAVNAGDLEDAPAHDIRGEPRDATPDVGAYEWVP
jgi:hypothetical protein